MEIAGRYIELILHYQSELRRDLELDEIQFIKNIVAKEIKEGREETIEKIGMLFFANFMRNDNKLC